MDIQMEDISKRQRREYEDGKAGQIEGWRGVTTLKNRKKEMLKGGKWRVRWETRERCETENTMFLESSCKHDLQLPDPQDWPD